MFGYLGSRALCNGWFGVEEPREGYSVDIILFFSPQKFVTAPLKWPAKSHSHLYVVLATNLESILIDSRANGRRIRSIQRVAIARFLPLSTTTRRTTETDDR
jgi:hypothetical protein